MSPPRHHIDKQKYEEQDMRGGNMKLVRPAYEHNTQAPNQAMYSGGFRPNIRDEQYSRSSPNNQRWQEREKFEDRNLDERKDTGRLQKFDIPRVSEHQRVIEEAAKARPVTRDSRSPRRERSPIRDRYRRHSPSPRSPRRSWALEKRRSPEADEAPPPPVWPGQDSRNTEYQRQDRPSFSNRENDKRIPTWERNHEESRKRLSTERGNENAQYSKWKSIMQERDSPSRFPDEEFDGPKDPKYRKKNFEEREDNYRREEKDRQVEMDRGRFGEREKFEDIRSVKTERDSKEEYIRKQIDLKEKDILLKQEELQKEIDDVYKRAVDFAKKAQLYRKSEQKSEHKSLSPDRYKTRYEEEQRASTSEFSKSSYRDEEIRSRRSDDNFRPKNEFQDAEAVAAAMKQKRGRAVNEISEKIVTKFGSQLPDDIRLKVIGVIKFKILRILENMFRNEDVSFIEMVVKYNAKHDVNDEKKIFDDVIAGFSTHFQSAKLPAQGNPNVAKKHVPESRFSKDQLPISNVASWNMLQTNLSGASVIPVNAVPPVGVMINQPVMVPLPNQYQFVEPVPEVPKVMETPAVPLPKKEGFSLYICKDDFQPFFHSELVRLKEFLIQELIKVTKTSQGWAPDFTINKVHNVYRYEVTTRDERSRDWLLGLDFDLFEDFNVLIYTTEELWYERAAIWLPGHSRSKIEPLEKLKLQNKKLQGVNIGKWKFVKKIVTDKGNRIYVDMPPSSARALENYKMKLSYELQKVDVFLKGVAVDKDAFDVGMHERSISVIPHMLNAPMPSIPDSSDIVKISLKGNKPLTLQLARKVKDMVIFKLFKYHQTTAKSSSTDFLNYGFCATGHFCVKPENKESKNWICSLELGKLNRQALVILGAENDNAHYIKMFIELPQDTIACKNKSGFVFERLRQSNQGVKGINFNMWKNITITKNKEDRQQLEAGIDLESVETLANMKFKLNYSENQKNCSTVKVTSHHSLDKLNNMIKKHKEEKRDSYVVANMEISSDSDDSDVIIHNN